jgi:hypothetical protein
MPAVEIEEIAYLKLKEMADAKGGTISEVMKQLIDDHEVGFDPSFLPPPPAIDKKELDDVLRRLNELAPFAHIKDPVAWQREIRKDRELTVDHAGTM